VVNPIKSAAPRAAGPLGERAELGKKKHPFMDFRESLRSGLGAESAPGGAGPLAPGKGVAETLTLGTPLAEGGATGVADPPALKRPAAAAAVLFPDDGSGNQAQLDPLEIVLAVPATPAAPLASDFTPRADFATAVEELVRRISWGGDRRSGTARIELGNGSLEGGSILVQALGRQVQVELDLPAGFDGRALEQRLRERLAARGIEVAAFSLR
jgi:hypothetical protein